MDLNSWFADSLPFYFTSLNLFLCIIFFHVPPKVLLSKTPWKRVLTQLYSLIFSLCREQFHLVLGSLFLSWGGLFWAWLWSLMGSSYSSGIVGNWNKICSIKYVLCLRLMMEFCSGFWPTLAVFLQKIPVLGWLFQQPYVRSVSSCA